MEENAIGKRKCLIFVEKGRIIYVVIIMKSLFKRFVKYYRPHKKVFFTDMLCSLGFSVLGLAYPLLSSPILNKYIPEGNIKMVCILSACLLGAYIVRQLFNYYISYFGHVMGLKIQAKMRSDLFTHLEKLPYSFYDNNETGQLMTRMSNDLFNVAELAHHGPENLFITTFMVLSSFTYLCTINWKLSLIVFAFLPILFLITLAIRKRMNAAFRESRQAVGEINATLENSIAGIRVTKAYANAEYEQNKFEKNNKMFVKARSKSYKYFSTYSASMGFVTLLYNVIVLFAGALFCIYDSENFAYGDLVTFMISINLFTQPITTLIAFFEQLQDGVTGLERYFEIIDAPIEQDKPDALEIQRFNGKIEFKNVSFSYSDDREILSDICLSIPEGKTYALVGASGGGKTTIAHLIPRFYEIDEGDILIDGISIKDIKNDSLRRNIGIVQQDVFLFTGTFKENIAYGKPDATDEEIFEAAKKANLFDYIMSLPDGFETEIGERGVKISGGQKQRLSIARVFIKNPSILILDEATSALDNTTEALIQQSLFELCKGRTTIIIAHRLSTVRTADKIIIINKGKICEEGTHQELLDNNGIYAELYHSQFDNNAISDIIDIG